MHLNLGADDAVAEATDQLAGLGAEILIEEFIAGSRVELLVNLRAEHPVGWLLTLGAGGTRTELDRDTVSLLLPVTADQIDDALRSLRIGPLFDGFRGAAPIPTAGVHALLASLAAMVATDPAIHEIELNPVLVTDERAVAADAIIHREVP